MRQSKNGTVRNHRLRTQWRKMVGRRQLRDLFLSIAGAALPGSPIVPLGPVAAAELSPELRPKLTAGRRRLLASGRKLVTNSFGECDAQCEESNHHCCPSLQCSCGHDRKQEQMAAILQAFFRMDSKQRPSIDIDQANGESTLLTISLFKLAAALGKCRAAVRWPVIDDWSDSHS